MPDYYKNDKKKNAEKARHYEDTYKAKGWGKPTKEKKKRDSWPY